jgi:hypothetical protein
MGRVVPVMGRVVPVMKRVCWKPQPTPTIFSLLILGMGVKVLSKLRMFPD